MKQTVDNATKYSFRVDRQREFRSVLMNKNYILFSLFLIKSICSFLRKFDRCIIYMWGSEIRIFIYILDSK
jgi:hypothetical protein